MNIVHTCAITPACADDDETTTAHRNFSNDARVFLGAFAAMLRETILSFEATVGRLSDIVVMHRGRVDRDLIVTLQDFDRLNQELVALGDAIAHYAAINDGLMSAGERARAESDMMAAISVADLKERFLRHLQGVTTRQVAPPLENDEVF